MKYVLFILFLGFAWKCQSQTSAPLYKIYDTRRQVMVQPEQLVAEMQDKDVLFFGEEHNDSIGHVVEALILKKLQERYPGRIALSLEMFHTDIQVIMDEYLAGVITEKNFLKESRPWSNVEDYKPLITFAKDNHLNVIAANAAARYSNAVSTHGLTTLLRFPKSSRAFLPPLPIDTAKGPYYEKFIRLLGTHNMGTMKVYQTQNLWDASMAWSIASYLNNHPGNKVLQINGRFHSDEHLGTVAKLRAYAPGTTMLTISCFPDNQFKQPDWKKWLTCADYIILTSPSSPQP